MYYSIYIRLNLDNFSTCQPQNGLHRHLILVLDVFFSQELSQLGSDCWISIFSESVDSRLLKKFYFLQKYKTR